MILWIVAAYALMSLITFIAYGIDKHRAKTGRWRIRESNLHFISFLGGWPGALVGQALFRHKRQKPSFMFIFAGIVLLHIAAWFVYISSAF